MTFAESDFNITAQTQVAADEHALNPNFDSDYSTLLQYVYNALVANTTSPTTIISHALISDSENPGKRAVVLKVIAFLQSKGFTCIDNIMETPKTQGLINGLDASNPANYNTPGYGIVLRNLIVNNYGRSTLGAAW